jgi:membrane protein DedA with SNARE-associated domain
MGSFRSFQDRLYEKTLRHDKQICVRVACCSPVIPAIVFAIVIGFKDIAHILMFCFATLCVAIGAALGASFMYLLLHYLRRRYEKEFLNQ